MTKIKLDNISKDDNDLVLETDAIDIDLDVQKFSEDYSGLENGEEVNQKTIAYLEKLIRKSYEYKQYITYLKSELDITKCAIVPTLDIKELDISLEFHHYPFTLYDIVSVITAKRLVEKKDDAKVSMFDIMEDTMRDHYSGIIGLVPLSKTMHEMAHNNAVKIPYESVYGNIDSFVAKYKPYISEELMDKLTNAKIIDDKTAHDFNTKLNKNVLHYNVQYNEKIED